MAACQFQDALEAEQARYIHRSVPTAALGGLIIVVLVVIVFRPIVEPRYLYAWLGAFLALTVARAPCMRSTAGRHETQQRRMPGRKYGALPADYSGFAGRHG